MTINHSECYTIYYGFSHLFCRSGISLQFIYSDIPESENKDRNTIFNPPYWSDKLRSKLIIYKKVEHDSENDAEVEFH